MSITLKNFDFDAPQGGGHGEGERLNKRYRLGAEHALFHIDGTVYNELERFPGVLCDADGYVLFASESDWRAAIDRGDMSLSKRRGQAVPILNVKVGIRRLKGYVRFPKVKSGENA